MPAHKRRFCKNGHDTDLCGRDTGGTCKGCRTEYQQKYCQAKLRKLHEYKIEKGGARCGYNRCGHALVFHHRDPRKKEFGIGRVLDVVWEQIRAEVAKYDDLCHNCHMEVHYGYCDT